MHLVLPEITSVGEVNGFFLHLVLVVFRVGLGGNCDIIVAAAAASSSGMPTEFVVQLLLRIGGVGGGSQVDGEGSGGGDGGVVVHDGLGWIGCICISSRIGGGSAFGMGNVSNPGLSDLYSDEKGLRLFAYREVDTYMYLLHTCVSEESLTCLRETKWSRAKV